MAIDAAAAERQLTARAEGDPADGKKDQQPASRRPGVPAFRTIIAAGLIAALTTAGLGGWVAYRLHQTQQIEARRSLFLEVGRQSALNLTTIDFADVDADIQRVVDSATGAFRQDFEQRSPQLADFVRKAQSKTEGNVTEAGIESIDGDSATVLVAVSVKASDHEAPDQPLRLWRMRIDLREDAGNVKVSNVGFVA